MKKKEIKMDEGMYRVTCYNEIDAEFGFDCGEQIVFDNVDKAQAKSYVRHMNKEMLKNNLPIYYSVIDTNDN